MKEMVAFLVAVVGTPARLCFAGAPSIEIHAIDLAYQSRTGRYELAHGGYRIAVDADWIRVMERCNGMVVEVALRLKTAERNFDNTAVTMQTVGDLPLIPPTGVPRFETSGRPQNPTS